ncbi:SpoIIE family protein phosphatase [Streptomyces avermitilis]|uniref:SpoIIE family protein phosphatase n=2 Tax=Streptomyces avermitilis TaxID=33903 RepID=UPI0033A7BAA1
MERLPTPAGQQADIPDASPAPARTATATISEQGIVTGWSEGARELLGYTPTQIVGHPAARLLADDTGEQARRKTAGRERFSGQVALLHRDGHRLPRNLLAHRRTPQDSRPAEWLVVTAVAASPRTPDSQALREWVFSQSPCILAVFDPDLRLVTANTGMESALLLPEEQMRGLRLPEITPGPASEEAETKMRRALETGQTQHMQAYLHPTGVSTQRGWSTSLTPLKDPGGTVRAVCLAAHHRQQEHLARQRMLLLNDAGARIGTTSDTQRTVQELTDIAVPRLADFAAVDLLDTPRRGSEPTRLPATGPITMHRTATHTAPDNPHNHAAPNDPNGHDDPHSHATPDSHTGHDSHDAPGAPPASPPAAGEKILYPALSPVAQCLAQGHGALYEADDPALTRWAAQDPTAAWIREQKAHSVMVVPLRAHGTTLGVALFTRSRRPEPFEADDLWLAEELTAQTAVHLHNAHRHAREHTTTMTLQRSLLPQTLPDQGALDIATRYLPAGSKAGVGGDWFDVIPLSGARVALVVGDVVGHGIRASATMGRVRTAVRTLADVDLPPDELLTYLDDLVIHLAADEGGGAEGTTETAAGIGTTCLYAVYDPVTRHCTIARAGHPPPAAVTPDGTVRFLNVPAGPPLGLGGLPFETYETQLPEGTLLALYTDGLLQTRDHDIDEGLDTMFQALARPAHNLDTVCDRILTTMLTHRPDDDIALLIARTRALNTHQTATFSLPSDPAIVAQARQHTTTQLTTWHLDDTTTYTTELIVSELVTNAIRYGHPPIQLRLIHHNHTLTTEVSDTSNTTPHMRRARTYDEGGRGLLLIAQLAQRWGTRHTPTGKTVWTEQTLTPN